MREVNGYECTELVKCGGGGDIVISVFGEMRLFILQFLHRIRWKMEVLCHYSLLLRFKRVTGKIPMGVKPGSNRNSYCKLIWILMYICDK